MKTGLVLEGGAMQGIYTVGVLDVFMENNIKFDGVIGVSAGALFGCNYISGQKGRALRYCKKYNPDKNYMGLLPFIKYGDVVNVEYAYERVPKILDPFDNEAFMQSDIPFWAVVTNMETGKAEYIQIKDVFKQMDDLRASGTMPYLSKPVLKDGIRYMDGAVADSIPFEAMFELGFDRLVVVLTKHLGYVKKPLPQTLSRLMYGRKSPLFDEAVRNRHIMYNGQKERLFKAAESGNIDIILPSEALYISKTEKNPAKLDSLYNLGRKDALLYLTNATK